MGRAIGRTDPPGHRWRRCTCHGADHLVTDHRSGPTGAAAPALRQEERETDVCPPNLAAFHQIHLDRHQRAIAAADAHRQARPHRPRWGLGPWVRRLAGFPARQATLEPPPTTRRRRRGCGPPEVPGRAARATSLPQRGTRSCSNASPRELLWSGCSSSRPSARSRRNQRPPASVTSPRCEPRSPPATTSKPPKRPAGTSSRGSITVRPSGHRRDAPPLHRRSRTRPHPRSAAPRSARLRPQPARLRPQPARAAPAGSGRVHRSRGSVGRTPRLTAVGAGAAPPPERGAGVYVLHAWIFEHNPAGMFEDWNPRVAYPTGARPPVVLARAFARGTAKSTPG